MNPKIQALDQRHREAWSAYSDAKGVYEWDAKQVGAASMALCKQMLATKGSWHEAGLALRDALKVGA